MYIVGLCFCSNRKYYFIFCADESINCESRVLDIKHVSRKCDDACTLPLPCLASYPWGHAGSAYAASRQLEFANEMSLRHIPLPFTVIRDELYVCIHVYTHIFSASFYVVLHSLLQLQRIQAVIFLFPLIFVELGESIVIPVVLLALQQEIVDLLLPI